MAQAEDVNANQVFQWRRIELRAAVRCRFSGAASGGDRSRDRRYAGDGIGRPTRAQILAMHLESSLVSLSGCSTARGPISAGEGPSSLSWAFVAVATSTIAKQWPIEANTSDLSVNFYRPWNFGRSSKLKAEAPRGTQLGMLNDGNSKKTGD